jgi:hypothetical protein
MVSIEVLNTIIQYARERARLNKESEGAFDNASEIEDESPEYKKINNKLLEFLFSLSDDDIKSVMTIMYVGRDNDHEEGQNPTDNFNEKYNQISWSDKSNDVIQIASKQPLAEYLNSGMTILQMKQVK